ncbi:CBS domain-containing protein [Amycolatopsis sp. NPDC026612]|uniref:CBS domain-containing protein n=1 Tax=Amycolatopsis sp. NPDC026612 TaxID=3155466 RepID=UPI0033FAED01
MMTGHGFTTMPVVDGDGQLLGLLSEADILRAPVRPAELTLSPPARPVRCGGSALPRPADGP